MVSEKPLGWVIFRLNFGFDETQKSSRDKAITVPTKAKKTTLASRINKEGLAETQAKHWVSRLVIIDDFSAWLGS
ncbi:MAG TPA: hypothetical protein IGS52_20575 [Oscillatoriaceae cyanobacterium M33_DOE_052]|uniref:Uncharacterized protein n=1 Tax=Planktothricoides sp. SpSt-374 TaxID=2282167 RepID=A0A7C3ZZD0_9CYAN|nr:hypothetical protein [Oscillatoriaceae cyanobacterium M33_DOE_052]